MKIAIVGTGLIGTSLGLALKAAKVKATIVGTDKNYDAAVKAQKRGALDKTERRLLNAVEDAELIVLAAPAMAIKEIMEFIGPHLAENSVVTDTASSKASVLAWADQYLPATVHFVGGHPIAGKEVSGPEEADATLFQGRIYCLVPGRRASQEAVRSVVQMVEWVGARPFFLNADEHDSYAAAVSHLPVLLAAALMRCASRSPSWPDISKVAAVAYKNVTSLASTSPEMNRDMCVTNPAGIVHWINEFIQELSEVRDALASGSDCLEPMDAFFASAWEERVRWLSGAVGHRAGPGIDRHTLGDQVGEMLMGRKLLDAYKRSMSKGDKKDKK